MNIAINKIKSYSPPYAFYRKSSNSNFLLFFLLGFPLGGGGGWVGSRAAIELLVIVGD